MGGLETAFQEISLVVFTTIAPGGAIGCALACVPIAASRVSDAHRRAISKFLFVPIVLSMIGLIFAASHLGNPDNALYVLTGVGRSPLSTEVAAFLVFLMACGTYWLYGFTVRPSAALQRVWCLAIVVFAVLAVYFISQAYDVRTIIGWNSPLAAIAVGLNGLMAGPVVACLTWHLAGYAPVLPVRGEARFQKGEASPQKGERFCVRLHLALWLLSAAAYVCCLIAYCAWGVELQGVGNFLASAGELVPWLWPMVGAFGALGLAGVVVQGLILLGPGVLSRTPLAGALGPRWTGVLDWTLAGLLLFGGVFVLRFAFYMAHLVVGLGL